MKKQKKYFLYGFILVLLFLAIVPFFLPGQKQAERRVNNFIEAVNRNEPGNIYTYLTPDLKSMISREEFSRNFAKERSYPYLTPLYIYLDQVVLSSDKHSGEAVMTVAARLPGQKMSVKLHFVNGRYYIEAFRDIVDGTYLEKFEKLK